MNFMYYNLGGFKPVNSDEAWEQARQRTEEEASLAQVTLDECSEHGLQKLFHHSLNGVPTSSRGPAEYVKLNMPGTPLHGKFRAISHPAFLLMPAMRLADAIFSKIKSMIADLFKRVTTLESKLSAETEDRSNEARKVTEQLAGTNAQVASTAQKVKTLTERVDLIENKPSDDNKGRIEALSSEVEQLKRENARLHEQYHRQFLEIEKRHSKQIRDLQLTITQRSGFSSEADSLESASDDDFSSPLHSDDDRI